ncbi:MAG: hypothetical protein A3D28_00720 [Omnitrophica bacterium RIFCSPHIGHO2_02_FULL_63_14]|nr:MAG: hypothetical protein A3D28_00720 [Omnitrophica bacterium RIFCSPHIGHO2_02_FULL_63_14]
MKSEFKLIEMIRAQVKSRGAMIGIGDDTAVLKGGRKPLLFTTDMLIENSHFRLSDATPFQIGRKALAVNVSDIAAMGGEPLYAVVALGLPARFREVFVKELYRGIESLAGPLGIGIVGGDTNASDRLIISVALLGRCQGHPILRSGAKPGDLIFVTGTLGNSYRSKKHLDFTPRVAEALLVRRFHPHAMIDVSDGLARDLGHITEASAVGAVLSREWIPVAPGASLEQALGEGEDFELLFTLAEKDGRRFLRSRFRGKTHFHPIGRIIKGPGLFLEDDEGRKTPLEAEGFDHFDH